MSSQSSEKMILVDGNLFFNPVLTRGSKRNTVDLRARDLMRVEFVLKDIKRQDIKALNPPTRLVAGKTYEIDVIVAKGAANRDMSKSAAYFRRFGPPTAYLHLRGRNGSCDIYDSENQELVEGVPLGNVRIGKIKRVVTESIYPIAGWPKG